MGRNRQKRLLLSIVGMLVIIAGAFSFIQYKQHVTKHNSTPEVAQKTAGTPEFSFDSSIANTWRQGPTDKVSMAMFDKDETTGCWVSIEHKLGTVDEAAELKKIDSNWTNAGMVGVVHGDMPTMLKMKSGVSYYTLHQYSVTSTTREKVLGGQEFAYFALPKGYAKVQGYCNNVEKLATITSALQALSFNDEQ